jgi:hypothetical protein
LFDVEVVLTEYRRPTPFPSLAIHNVPPNRNATSYPSLGLGPAGAGRSSIAPGSVAGPSGYQYLFSRTSLP